jgi:hypothetical protein
MFYRTLSNAVFAVALTVSVAQAQEEDGDPIPFSDGNFTITENDNMEKLLSFEGQEISKGYYLAYDRTVKVDETDVALFQVGPGGNACGPQTLIIWKSEGEGLQTAAAGDDCGSPSPSVSDSAIYFVPYLLPGSTAPVQVWTVDEGLKLAGVMSYAPQPGTDWESLDISKMTHLVDVFSNEAVLSDATALLGDKLYEVVTGLSVSDGFHMLDSGVAYGSGCVPHACSLSDSFIAIDKADHKLYFAQQDGEGGQDAWPALDTWPAEIKEAMLKAIGN